MLSAAIAFEFLADAETRIGESFGLCDWKEGIQGLSADLEFRSGGKGRLGILSGLIKNCEEAKEDEDGDEEVTKAISQVLLEASSQIGRAHV